MRYISKRRPSSALAVAVLALVAAVVGTALADPAAITTKANNQVKKLKKKLKQETEQRESGDNARYTKDEADATFAEDGQSYTRAQADDAFLANGTIRIRENGPFTPHSSDGGAVVSTGGEQALEAAAPPDRFYLYLTEPRALGGKAHRLTSVEVCYRLNDGSPSGDAVDRTQLFDPGSGATPISNTTPRTSHGVIECYSVAPSSPYSPAAALTLELRLVDGGDGFNNATIAGVTSTWSPAP